MAFAKDSSRSRAADALRREIVRSAKRAGEARRHAGAACQPKLSVTDLPLP